MEKIQEIYLDNSATTRPSEEAVAAANDMMLRFWGNPSSTHAKGSEAAAKLREARRAVASALSAAPEEIFFTSGGTEANNIAVFGAAANIEKAVNADTALVTMMMVNNEVGSVLPVEAAVRAARRNAPRAIVHCDCVQAFGKIPVSAKKLGADLITVSAHKIHAPKGVGALYKRKGLHIPSLTHGGHQEDSFRPGTEAAPLIAAFGAAASVACDRVKISERYKKISGLRNDAVQRLNEIRGIVINSPEDALPYIVNFSTCCVKAETMLNYLSERGIYVSGGSACAKGEPSHVIKALRLPRDASDSAIRVSFCGDSTAGEIDALVNAVKEGINRLAHFN